MSREGGKIGTISEGGVQNIVFGSVVDPKIFFFRSGSFFDLNFGSGSGLFMKITYIRNLDHLNIATKPDCFEKFI